MAKEIRTEVLINAIPEKVWQVFTNFAEYPNWNPFIKSLKGEVAINKNIEVLLSPPGSSAMTFKPKVLEYKKHKEFRWLGHLLFPGIFDGEHKFELIDNGNGTTTFIQSEKFKGILVPLMKNMLDKNTTAGFNHMNQKLKERVEKN